MCHDEEEVGGIKVAKIIIYNLVYDLGQSSFGPTAFFPKPLITMYPFAFPLGTPASIFRLLPDSFSAMGNGLEGAGFFHTIPCPGMHPLPNNHSGDLRAEVSRSHTVSRGSFYRSYTRARQAAVCMAPCHCATHDEHVELCVVIYRASRQVAWARWDSSFLSFFLLRLLGLFFGWDRPRRSRAMTCWMDQFGDGIA